MQLTPRILFLFGLTLWLTSATGQEVKVLSFNVRVDVDDGERAWSSRKNTVIGVAYDQDADFIGIQEALPHQAADMDAGLPDHSYFGRGREWDGSGEGSNIFYKDAIWDLDPNENGTFQLSDTPEQWGSNTWNLGWVRICTWGRFTHKTTGLSVYLYNTHYPLDAAKRDLCSDLIAARIASRTYANEPIILTGDFNADEHEASVLYFQGQGGSPVSMVDTYREIHPDEVATGTHGTWGAGPTENRKIDYVFASGHDQVIAAEILFPQNGAVVSDHFPITGTVYYGEITPLDIPGRIEAEDYRTMSGVQKESTQDVGGGMNVGYFDQGDYLQFNINAAESSNYQVISRLAGETSSGAYELFVDDVSVGTVTTPVTGGWQIWDNDTVIIPISQGEHVLKLQVLTGGFNLNYLDFTAGNFEVATPPTDTTATGGRLFADYDHVDLSFTGFAGSDWAEVDNPSPSGRNPSEFVGKTTTGIETWAGIFTTAKLSQKIDFSTKNLFKMKVFGPKTGEIIVKFEENGNKDLSNFELTFTTTKVNQWEEITLDFSDAPDLTFDDLVLFFDYGTANQDTWYFDDIRLEAPMDDCNGDLEGGAYVDGCSECVEGNTGLIADQCFPTQIEDQDANSLTLWPNPSTDRLVIQSVPGDYRMINQLGIVVAEFSSTGTYQIDVGTWLKGIYIIQGNTTTARWMKQY